MRESLYAHSKLMSLRSAFVCSAWFTCDLVKPMSGSYNLNKEKRVIGATWKAGNFGHQIGCFSFPFFNSLSLFRQESKWCNSPATSNCILKHHLMSSHCCNLHASLFNFVSAVCSIAQTHWLAHSNTFYSFAMRIDFKYFILISFLPH